MLRQNKITQTNTNNNTYVVTSSMILAVRKSLLLFDFNAGENIVDRVGASTILIPVVGLEGFNFSSQKQSTK